jgi:hypothetical protein
MQHKFVIRGREFLLRDLDSNDAADFQYLDNFYREIKKCDKITEVKEKNKIGSHLAQKVVVELAEEPRLSMEDMENGGLIEDMLASQVLEWITKKLEIIVKEQKKN